MDPSREARLRAVLFTDMVGSSQLRSRLGDDRADDLRRHHDRLLDEAVAAHRGEVLRWTGDGVKATFATASAAVAAAIDLQRAVQRYARNADAVAPSEVRVGIGVGEVTREDDDEHGVAVIEGARLEALAAPGEILATDLVRRLGQRRVDAAFEEVGVHALKGLDQPVAIVRVVDTAADAAARPMPGSILPDRRFPLVGRGPELGLALGRWGEVAAGAAATVLVAGHPGLGKSRFIAHVAGHAHAAGAAVLAGICDSDLAVPYQPFAMAFGDAPARDEELAAAVEGGTGPLGALFPTRRAGRLDDPGPAARFELFEAVVALVDRLAHEQPLVLVLEDLQWAAPPTVQLLRHLVRHATDARVLLLASYRNEEVGPAHPLQDLLADVHSSATVTRLELEGLDEAAVAELVAARVPDAREAGRRELARRIHAESAGSPFFVCELLHHLSSTGELADLVRGGDATGRLPIPDSVRAVMGQRLGRLSDPARELLTVAATIGLTFDLELLAEAGGAAPESVLEVLEDVARRALVSEVDAGRFTFAHAIVRATLLEQLTATRAALAHRRIAESIVALGRPDHDELAHHWRLAGDEERATVHLERAAQRDLEALAYESAADRFQAVLDHHSRAPARDEAAVARAWLGVGLARRALGQPDYLLAVEEAGRIGRRLRDVDLVADAAVASIWPGNFFVTAGETDASLVELNEDALALVGGDDPRRTRILSALASHLTFDGDRERRVALLAEAHDLATALGDPELIGGALVAEFLALWDPTTVARRAEITRTIGRMARASGDVDLEFFAGFFGAVTAAERGDVATARRRLGSLDGPVTASQNFYFGFLVERMLVALDIYTGREGVQQEVDALAARYAGTHADTAGTWALQTGGLAHQAGALGALAPTLRTMIEESPVAPNWMPPYGLALLESGDRAGAAAVLDGFTEPPLDYFWLTTMQALGELAAALGDVERARALVELLAPYREQLGITASGTYCVGLLATTLGLLALTVGDPAAAVDLLEEAVARADEMGAPFEAVRSRRLLATAHLALDGPSDVVTALVAAAAAQAARHGLAGEQRLLAPLDRVPAAD